MGFDNIFGSGRQIEAPALDLREDTAVYMYTGEGRGEVRGPSLGTSEGSMHGGSGYPRRREGGVRSQAGSGASLFADSWTLGLLPIWCKQTFLSFPGTSLFWSYVIFWTREAPY